MTHFSTLVLVEPDLTDGDAVYARIGELIEPYNENTQVDPYQRPCYCVGSIARRAAYDAAEAAHPLRPLRAQLWNEFTPDQMESAACNARWETLIAPHKAVVAEVEAAHPQQGQPDPTCPDCNGTGTYESTYNPQSKWDWWEIGGRWGGILPDSGVIVADLDPTSAQGRVCALVTPDGAWHEEARVGWFATRSNVRPDWPARVQQLLSEFPRYRAVLCDLHI